MKCADLVIQDHVILRRALDILDALVRKLERGERIEITNGLTVLTLSRLFAIEYHQMTQETTRHPALLSLAPHESPAQHMLFEHAEQRTLLSALDTALSSRRGAEFVRASRALAVLLRNHFDREDNVLRNFKECISTEEDEAVAAEI